MCNILGDILKANDELTVVINSYKQIMGLTTEKIGVSSENGTSKASKVFSVWRNYFTAVLMYKVNINVLKGLKI